MKILHAILFVLLLTSSGFPQFTRAKLDWITDHLKPLEMKKSEVEAILSPDSLSSSAYSLKERQSFYRLDENVDAVYSSGKCEDSQTWFLPYDAWSVPEGTLVRFGIEPKDQMSAAQLGIDLRSFRRQRAHDNYKWPEYYFDKSKGIAVQMWGDYVHYIEIFPAGSSQLCNDPRVLKYFSNSKIWRYSPQPRNIVIDSNFPANVTDLTLIPQGVGMVGVTTTAVDPDDEVMRYGYKVSAGKIIGAGAKVIWDLSNLPPGTYSITAAVDDSLGLRGRYITKSVTVPTP